MSPTRAAKPAKIHHRAEPAESLKTIGRAYLPETPASTGSRPRPRSRRRSRSVGIIRSGRAGRTRRRFAGPGRSSRQPPLAGKFGRSESTRSGCSRPARRDGRGNADGHRRGYSTSLAPAKHDSDDRDGDRHRAHDRKKDVQPRVVARGADPQDRIVRRARNTQWAAVCR